MATREGLPREATSVRLTPEARKLWALMAAEGGMTQAGWLEMMIRQAAKRRKVSLPDGELEPKLNRQRPQTTSPPAGAELAGPDPWQSAAVAAKEYYETDPEAVEWAMFAGDTTVGAVIEHP
jgi:hypothetical protein